MKKENIEKFYDYFDNVCELLYNRYNKPYLDSMNEAFEYLLDDEVESSYDEDVLDEMMHLKELISDVSFNPEEVRKAVQLGLLKGYKHTYSSNALITPDTIGIFIGYLVKKLYKNRTLENILDPLMGTGNLVYSIINYMEKDIKAYGIDNDHLKCNLAKNIGDLMDIENEVFYQDTLTYYDKGFDLVVADMPVLTDDDNYLPFQIINHHIDSLIDGGYFISIIDNDFFEKKNSGIFRQEIDKKGYIFGLIKLSESLFKNNPKSILILRKKGENVKQLQDFLLVDLPGFNDINNFNNVINHIDLWIAEREEEL